MTKELSSLGERSINRNDGPKGHVASSQQPARIGNTNRLTSTKRLPFIIKMSGAASLGAVQPP
jgi:hypothetical protein